MSTLTTEQRKTLQEAIEYHSNELDRMLTAGGYSYEDLDYHRDAIRALQRRLAGGHHG